MIARFLSFTEIQTKITSIFAFFMAFAYLFYREHSLNVKLTGIFFASMILLDLATTAINNYIDTKTNDKELPFKRKKALIILLILLLSSMVLGLYLVCLTDLLVLLLGGLCFLCGIFYTFGPVPISRIPLGEILSGLFYGFFIPFLFLYINMPPGTYVEFELAPEFVAIKIRFISCFTVILLSAAPFLSTANIMLANNICDMDKDISVKRFTLAYYLQGKALGLFAWTYYAVYPATMLLVAMGALHPVNLLLLLTVIPVKRNINIFLKMQDKKLTFPVSIKNYIIIVGTDILLIGLSGFL